MFQTWLLFSIEKGCHPSHWRSLHHFSWWKCTKIGGHGKVFLGFIPTWHQILEICLEIYCWKNWKRFVLVGHWTFVATCEMVFLAQEDFPRWKHFFYKLRTKLKTHLAHVPCPMRWHLQNAWKLPIHSDERWKSWWWHPQGANGMGLRHGFIFLNWWCCVWFVKLQRFSTF